MWHSNHTLVCHQVKRYMSTNIILLGISVVRWDYTFSSSLNAVNLWHEKKNFFFFQQVYSLCRWLRSLFFFFQITWVIFIILQIHIFIEDVLWCWYTHFSLRKCRFKPLYFSVIFFSVSKVCFINLLQTFLALIYIIQQTNTQLLVKLTDWKSKTKDVP